MLFLKSEILKSIINISLITLIIFQSAFWSGFLIIKKEIHFNKTKSIIKTISKKKLSTFNFSKTEFKNLHWVKPDKEFILNNNFYDVVSTKKTNNNIEVICYKDIKDKQIAKILEKNNNSNHNDDNILSKAFDIKYLQLVKIFNNYDLFFKIRYNDFLCFTQTRYLQITVPPPRYIFIFLNKY